MNFIRRLLHKKHFKQKKTWCCGVNFHKEKMEVLQAERNTKQTERKQSPLVIIQQTIFHNVLILCFWLRIIRSTNRDVKWIFLRIYFLNNFDHSCRTTILRKKSLWLLPYLIVVPTSCYYEKVHRTMHTVVLLYLFKHEQKSFKILFSIMVNAFMYLIDFFKSYFVIDG